MNVIPDPNLTNEDRASEIKKMIYCSQTISFGGYEVAKSLLSVRVSNSHSVSPLV